MCFISSHDSKTRYDRCLFKYSQSNSPTIQITAVICLVCKHSKTGLAFAFAGNYAVPVAFQYVCVCVCLCVCVCVSIKTHFLQSTDKLLYVVAQLAHKPFHFHTMPSNSLTLAQFVLQHSTAHCITNCTVCTAAQHITLYC
jgi:predicted metallopeptidase